MAEMMVSSSGRVLKRQDKAIRAEAEFKVLASEAGLTVLGAYVNARTPVQCICRNGHECNPRPGHLKSGYGPCRACVNLVPAKPKKSRGPIAQVEVAFRNVACEIGLVVVGKYVDTKTPVACICRNGHECSPRPKSILAGSGPCSACAFDYRTYYIVSSSTLVKPGVTQLDHRKRLYDHNLYFGLSKVDRLFKDLPDGFAWQMERSILNQLKEQAIQPVAGREYFDIQNLNLIVTLADSYIGENL